MAFIAQFGGDLKEGKTREFVEWLNANEKEYANAHPEGARYIGTYFSIFQSDKKSGSVHTFVELESYGTQDAMAAAGRDADSVYSKLLNEATSFFDPKSENWTQSLYKKATDATLYGED
jgi:hypothetical protein